MMEHYVQLLQLYFGGLGWRSSWVLGAENLECRTWVVLAVVRERTTLVGQVDKRVRKHSYEDFYNNYHREYLQHQHKQQHQIILLRRVLQGHKLVRMVSHELDVHRLLQLVLNEPGDYGDALVRHQWTIPYFLHRLLKSMI